MIHTFVQFLYLPQSSGLSLDPHNQFMFSKQQHYLSKLNNDITF